MVVKSKKKTLVCQKVSTFCQHCTIHGVYYFDSTRWLVIFTWTLILAGSVGLCAFLISMIWSKFNLDPTVTVIETTHYSTSKIPFPAIIICETENVYGPNTKNITELFQLRGFNDSEIGEFYDSFSKVRGGGYIPSAPVLRMHSLLEDLGYPLKKVLLMIRKPCEVLIEKCIWRSQNMNCSMMFREVVATMGVCCRFDTQYFKENGGNHYNYTSGMEITESLVLEVNGKKTNNEGTDKNGFLMLYVIDPANSLTYVDSAVTLTPSAFFDVSINLWAIDSSEPVKALPIRSRKCFLPSDGLSASFYEGCVTMLIMRRVAMSCRCLPFHYTAEYLGVSDYSFCLWNNYICVFKTLEIIKSEMQDITSNEKCYQKCDFIQYEYSLEHIIQGRMSSELQNGISRVAFHFSDNTCMKYRREVLYTWDQMLANLGGIFGLCLGGSIISIVELFWFIIDILHTVFFYKSNNVASAKKENGWMKNNIKTYPYHN